MYDVFMPKIDAKLTLLKHEWASISFSFSFSLSHGIDRLFIFCIQSKIEYYGNNYLVFNALQTAHAHNTDINVPSIVHSHTHRPSIWNACMWAQIKLPTANGFPIERTTSWKWSSSPSISISLLQHVCKLYVRVCVCEWLICMLENIENSINIVRSAIKYDAFHVFRLLAILPQTFAYIGYA